MLCVARRNLLYDPVRFAATLIGVTCAVLLMTAQIGVYVGFMKSASQIVDHAGADLWMVKAGTVNFDSASPFSERKLEQARAVRGVVRTAPLVHAWGFLALPAGRTELVELIGFDPRTGAGGPWRLREGRIADLAARDGFIVDASFLERLGGLRVGERAEYFGRSVELVAISDGVSSLTTYPIVFTSIRSARAISGFLRPDETNFGLIWLDPALSAVERGRALAELRAIPGIEVHTREAYSRLTRRYWTLETGFGTAFGVAILLGFAVGVVIVGQTIYAATVHHLREYGTLKAMGATNGDLYRIVFHQALASAVAGYLLGAGATLLVVRLYVRIGVKVEVTAATMAAMLAATLLMCFLASLLSVRRLARLEPALVFRG